MLWRQVKYKKLINFRLIALFAIVFPLSAQVHALDEKRLWLPTKYQKLFLDLKEAALATEALGHCKTVLRGTIDLEQSRKDHPIYRILCRKSDGRSYNEMVDGLTLELLTSNKPVDVSKIEERKLHLWTLCEEKVNDEVKLMKDMTWISELPVKPKVYDDAKVHFIADFDAKDGYGTPLRYQAFCKFGVNDILSVRISPRKND